MTNNSFVITALNNWSPNHPSFSQSLAQEISKYSKVLYVNPPVNITPPLDKKNTPPKESKYALTKVKHNLWVLNPPIATPNLKAVQSEELFDYLNKLSSRHYAQIVNWAMTNVKMSNIVLINDNDIVRNHHPSSYLNPWLSIYFYHTDLPITPYNKYLAQSLIKQSDIIVTTSQSLAERARIYNFNTFNIGYGVDLGACVLKTIPEIPPQMALIPSPRIGFIGSLCSNTLSAHLIYQLALSFPECSIVLAGSEDAVFAHHPLHNLANVYFFGEITEDKIPSHIAHFDVCINPQNYNAKTDSSVTQQLICYLSMGKSVVSTYSESALTLSPYIYIANNDQNFLDLTQASLKELISHKKRLSRIEYARGMSWHNCAERLFSVIDMFENQLRESYQASTNGQILV